MHARKTRPRVVRSRNARAPWPLLVCEPGGSGATRISTTTCAISKIQVAFCWPTPRLRIPPPRCAICGHPQLQCLQVCTKSARLKRSSWSDRGSDCANRSGVRRNLGVQAQMPFQRDVDPRSMRVPLPLPVCEPSTRGATRIMTTTCAISMLPVAFCWSMQRLRIPHTQRVICGHPRLQRLQVSTKSARLKRSSSSDRAADSANRSGVRRNPRAHAQTRRARLRHRRGRRPPPPPEKRV